MNRSGAWQEIKVACPYCTRSLSVFATCIQGELRAFRCVGCSQPFIVEVLVSVSTKVRGVVDASAKLVDSPRAGSNPPPPIGARPAPPPNPPPPPRRVRSIDGERY